MNKKTEGLYPIYKIERLDGSSRQGEKHHGCFHFVLDLKHDKHAVPAIQAYIESCKKEYPLLAADLQGFIDRKGDYS